MNPLISIPRDELAELLRLAGSPLTPEQYVASLPEMAATKKYPGRARAAAVSRNTLLVVAVLSFVLLPAFGITVESVVIVAGLAVVTFFEYRVCRYFREDNPLAPDLGFRNQSAFAAGILAYGLYHAAVPTRIPSSMDDLIDPSMMAAMQGLERIIYLVVGVVGGVSQFGLAWYYRSARSAPAE
jgi:hypothetical protein